jgi:hypothetical protein
LLTLNEKYNLTIHIDEIRGERLPFPFLITNEDQLELKEKNLATKGHEGKAEKHKAVALHPGLVPGGQSPPARLCAFGICRPGTCLALPSTPHSGQARMPVHRNT